MTISQGELDARCGTNADQRARLRRGEPPARVQAMRSMLSGFVLFRRIQGVLFLLPLVIMIGVAVWLGTPASGPRIPLPVVAGFVGFGLLFVFGTRRATRIPIDLVAKRLEAPVRIEELELRLITRDAKRTRTHHHHHHHGVMHDGVHRESYMVREAVLIAADGRHFTAPDGLAELALEGRFRVFFTESQPLLGIQPAEAGQVWALEIA